MYISELDGLKRIDEFLELYEGKKILLVTGKKSFEKSGAKMILEQKMKNERVDHFSDFSINPKFDDAIRGAEIARLANNGAYPPDLSLIVKARGGGADYIYSLLNGYKDFPENFEASEGMYYNEYYPGNQIAMPPQIEDDIVEFDDGTIATHNQIARDITSFLAWTAEPELERRKSLGVKTLFFLVLITIMLLGVKRKVWKHLD